MPILETCCFWKDVRHGSFASGIYTMVYFGLSTLMLLFYVNEEQEFLFGEGKQPVGESIIEKGDLTLGTVIFNILFLVCSMLMMLSSVVMIIGLRNNKRQFLIPWIFLMLCDLLIEVAHLIHLSLAKRVVFDPIVGFIFTIDFFIMCLNLYCLLCVLSQYQVYRAQHSVNRPQMSPIVTFSTPPNVKKAAKLSLKSKSSRMLNASPLITSQRLTNFSTITEEDEQCRTKLQTSAPNEPIVCQKLSENPTTSEACEITKTMTNIPIVTLDPNSLQ